MWLLDALCPERVENLKNLFVLAARLDKVGCSDEIHRNTGKGTSVTAELVGITWSIHSGPISVAPRGREEEGKFGSLISTFYNTLFGCDIIVSLPSSSQ